MVAKRWKRTPDALHTDLASSKVLLHMVDGTYYDLQGVGGTVWTLLEKPRTLEELVARVTEEYDAPADQVRKDMQRFLADLQKHALVDAV